MSDMAGFETDAKSFHEQAGKFLKRVDDKTLTDDMVWEAKKGLAFNYLHFKGDDRERNVAAITLRLALTHMVKVRPELAFN